MDVNVRGIVLASRLVLPSMLARRDEVVANDLYMLHPSRLEDLATK